MSDDESFVILGSSPNSVENFSTTNKDSSLSGVDKNVTDSGNNTISHQPNEKLQVDRGNSEISLDFNYHFMDNSSKSVELTMPEVNIARRLKRDSLTTPDTSVKTNGTGDSIQQNSPKISLLNGSFLSNSSIIGNGGMVNKPSAHQGTLAANFLMGDIDLEELKEKAYSQFPSLCGSHINNTDILALQNLMSQNAQLWELLKRNNIALGQHFAIIKKWQDDIKIFKEDKKNQEIKFEETIAKLNIDNIQLKQEMESKIEHFKLNENFIRDDNKKLNMQLSEQNAQIQNMTSQIQKLEQQNLATFEYVPKKDDEKPIEKNPEHEYVSILEHKRITKNFERQLSELTAKNLDLEDMKEQYIDEINCLKVSLTSAEELLKKAQTDINMLKSKDIERVEFFENYQRERDEMKQNIELLKKQVDIYNNDFQIERTDRQNIAEEKEEILNELKLLQRRNQQLIEEQQARLESSSSRGATRKSVDRPIPSSRTPPKQQKEEVRAEHIHVCPLCNTVFTCLDTLQIHVQECIDQ